MYEFSTYSKRHREKTGFFKTNKKLVILIVVFLTLPFFGFLYNSEEECDVPALNQGRKVITTAPIEISKPKPMDLSAYNVIDYFIVRGDNLSIISNRLGVSLELLKTANSEIDCRKLNIGDKINIPMHTQKIYVKVQRGDTLWEISRMFNISIKDLMRKNRLNKNSKIYPNMKLRVL